MNTENVVKHLRAAVAYGQDHRRHQTAPSLIGLGLRAFAALIAAFGL